jgi:hypothetical protein
MSSKDNFQRVQNACRQGGFGNGQIAAIIIQLMNSVEELQNTLHDIQVAKALEKK